MAERDTNKIQIMDLDRWDKGLISYFSPQRMPLTGLKEADNVVFDYNGVVKPRGCFLPTIVPDIGDEGFYPLSQDFAFRRKDGTEGLLVAMSNGTTAYIYTLNRDYQAWKKHSLQIDPVAKVSIDQINGQVVFVNNVDKYAYYDMETDAIVQFQFISNPTIAPTATKNGMSGTDTMDYHYRITWNGVGGSTKMSPVAKVSTAKIRENWGGNEYIRIVRNNTPPANAKSWSIQIASTPTGSGTPTEEEYLYLSEDIPLETTSYDDNGSMLLLNEAPLENTTEGIKAKYIKNISGRLWALDSNYAYYGGNAGREHNFGSTNGAGKYNVSNGGRETPMAIGLGRDNAGTSCINLFTRVIAGQGAVWDVYATTNTIQAGDNNISQGTFQFKKREGNDGTDAPFSLIHENNNHYYLSMDGFKSTGVKPNITGIQSTDIASSAIRDRVLNLNHNNLLNCYVAYYDEAIYWTIAYGQRENNEIWVYDILHGGVWSTWKIEADTIFRWNSSEDESPSLYIRRGNKLLRYNKTSKRHADNDTEVFTSQISSGLIPFKGDFLTWVHLLRVVWQLNSAKGHINITVKMHGKNGNIVKSRLLRLSDIESNTTLGWGAINSTNHWRGGWGEIEGWGKVTQIQSTNIENNVKISQKIRKNINYLSFTITVSTADSFYELSHVGLLFTMIGEGIEFLSQKGMYKI